jgi:hypothetical protein
LKNLHTGDYYKVQIAYVHKKENTIGYFSTVGVVKYTGQPTITIENLDKDINQANMHQYNYVGVYKPSPNDVSEKAYSYCLNLYDENNKLL